MVKYTQVVLLRLFGICLFAFIVVFLLIGGLPTGLETCRCEEHEHERFHKTFRLEQYDQNRKKLAIVVPFRDRFDELLQFAPHMAAFLDKQGVPFHIFVVNQNDRYRFNRASLINAGFLEVRDRFDYFAMHDVDLLPLNDNLRYEYPEEGPLHISGPDYHPKYHYSNFIGGILLLKMEHFVQLNGMSNRYWGWGLEDDEFFVRIKDAGLEVYRSRNITTGTNNTFLHVHDRLHRKRDTTKCFNQRESTRRRDRKTGLNTLKYSIASRRELTIDGVPVSVLNVDLVCDKEETPWCECPAPTEAPTQRIKKKGDSAQRSLDANLFGQHIAKKLVVDAIGGHFQQIHKSEKPLVISFHGAPGTGKNYIAEHIANALFEKGSQSKFVHKYLGRIDFPLESNINEYKFRLVEDIKRATAKCPTSLFIFDEVEKMPAGLFDTIVSLLDNHAYTKDHNFRQSIFIFLSNVAGPEIANQLKLILDKGTWREGTELHDFERTLEISAYNLEGGLYRSEMIESHVVDHFVPFLPLEQRHVEKCIIREYHKLTGSQNIDENLLKDILREAVTFDETGIFSNNGCKRVSKKVESFYYNRLRKAHRNQEL